MLQQFTLYLLIVFYITEQKYNSKLFYAGIIKNMNEKQFLTGKAFQKKGSHKFMIYFIKTQLNYYSIMKLLKTKEKYG